MMLVMVTSPISSVRMLFSFGCVVGFSLLAGPADGKVNDEGYIYYPIKCSDAPRR
jgi:hypothetical protein